MSYEILYPEFAECILPTSEMVREWKKDRDMELELRFGKIEGNAFVASVPTNFMHQVVSFVETNNTTVWSTEWQQVQDYYYKNKHGLSIRTRVTYDTKNMKIKTEHISKDTVSRNTFNAVTNSEEFVPDIRISLSRETKVQQHNVPTCILPDFVRFRQRKSVFIGTRENPTWRLDFTMSWDSTSRDSAELKQKNEVPLFEIECELLDRDYCNTRSDEHVALSLLLKAKDLLENMSSINWRHHLKKKSTSSN